MNRTELIKKIEKLKTAKGVSIVIIIISILSYVLLDNEQVKTEKELLLLDAGKLDEVVLGE